VDSLSKVFALLKLRGGLLEIMSSELPKSFGLVLDGHGEHSGMLNEEGVRCLSLGTSLSCGAEVVEVVEILDHQLDDFRIIARVIIALWIICCCFESDDSEFSFLRIVSTIRSWVRSAICSYLECLIIKGFQEVVRLTAENGLVEVEAVCSAIDFAV
jgi:hypothetical protein